MSATSVSAKKTKKSASSGKTSRGSSAEEMASRQREISVSEFFAKNRHLLGFDNPRKAMLTTVKEAVDNALDACEEAGILPDIYVEVLQLTETRFRITIRDNGPGIVRKQIENIFGKLLYGSKFHRLKMSRGQQGIGISAAGMYGLMTTGQPVVIITKVKRKSSHEVILKMDTSKNRADVVSETERPECDELFSSGSSGLVMTFLRSTVSAFFRRSRRILADLIGQRPWDILAEQDWTDPRRMQGEYAWTNAGEWVWRSQEYAYDRAYGEYAVDERRHL